MPAGDSRTQIFEGMRAACPPDAPAIARAPRDGSPPADLVEVLRANLEAAGGELIEVASIDRLSDALPELDVATHCWSAVPDCAPRGIATTASSERELASLDLTLLPGELAVAESGAVWNVPRSPMERAAALLAETLVLVVPRECVVATLHDAYAAITRDDAAFGWYVSGPSKTADIEQALVLGAHGARRMKLVLVGAGWLAA